MSELVLLGDEWFPACVKIRTFTLRVVPYPNSYSSLERDSLPKFVQLLKEWFLTQIRTAPLRVVPYQNSYSSVECSSLAVQIRAVLIECFPVFVLNSCSSVMSGSLPVSKFV